MPARIGNSPIGVGHKHPVTRHRVSFSATSSFLLWQLRRASPSRCGAQCKTWARDPSEQWFCDVIVLSQPSYDLFDKDFLAKLPIWISKTTANYWSWSACTCYLWHHESYLFPFGGGKLLFFMSIAHVTPSYVFVYKKQHATVVDIRQCTRILGKLDRKL